RLIMWTPRALVPITAWLVAVIKRAIEPDILKPQHWWNYYPPQTARLQSPSALRRLHPVRQTARIVAQPPIPCGSLIPPRKPPLTFSHTNTVAAATPARPPISVARYRGIGYDDGMIML